MAENFIVGEKRIQAVDELGRWANGKILDVDDGNGLLVTFFGYPDDDLRVPASDIREPILSREQYQRENPAVRVKRRDGPSTKMLKRQRQFLLLCERGHKVATLSGEKTIQLVDPFKLTLHAEDGSSIDVGDIILPDTCNEKPPRKRKSLAKKKTGQQKLPKIAKPSRGANLCQQEEVADHPMASEHQLPFMDTDKEVSDGLVYTIGPFSCGDIAMAKVLNMELLIQELNIYKDTAVASPIRDGQLVEDISVTLPLNKMECSPMKPKGKIKKEGEKMRDKAYKATIAHLQNADFRNRFFRNQRKYSIIATIQKALTGRVPHRSFELGPIIPGVDDQLVPFHDRSVTYSYRNSNLHMLDSLLGSNWDIHMSCGATKFVTCLKFHLGKGDQLNGLVKVGEYPGEVSCRETLRNYIKT